jgi:hypothetical protein
MMVYKYEFSVDDEVTIKMPVGAKVLHVGSQHYARGCIWALVDEEMPHLQDRRFLIRGTGHPVPEAAAHLGTWFDGPFVWHIFEEDS